MSTISGGDLIALISGGAFELTAGPTAPTPPSESGTALDTELRQVAYDVIDELGKTLTYTEYPASSHEPTTGEVILGDPSPVNRKSIPPFEYKDSYIDGDLIRKGDMQTGVAALDITFTPAKGMLVTFDSLVWTLIDVKSLYSGVLIALYLFQLRR